MKTKRSLLAPFTSALPLSLALLAPACAASEEPDPNMTADAVGEGAPWVGKTYLLEVPDSRWTEPRGIGAEIGPYVPGFLIRVDGSTGNDVSVTLGTALPDGSQDACTPTTEHEGVSSAYPALGMGPLDMVVQVRNLGDPENPVVVDATIRNLTFGNVLPEGDTETEAGELTAAMDFREIAHLLTLLPTADPDAACAASESGLMAPCEPCPHDDEPYCLFLEAEELGAVEAAAELEEIAEDERGSECAEMLRE